MAYDYCWSPKDREGKTLFDFEFEVDCEVVGDGGDIELEIGDITVDGVSLMDGSASCALPSFASILKDVVYADTDFLYMAAEDQGWSETGAGGNDPDSVWVRG